MFFNYLLIVFLLVWFKDVTAYRLELEGIIVKGKGCPKPIKTWVQCGVSMKILNALKKWVSLVIAGAKDAKKKTLHIPSKYDQKKLNPLYIWNGQFCRNYFLDDGLFFIYDIHFIFWFPGTAMRSQLLSRPRQSQLLCLAETSLASPRPAVAKQ